MSIHRSIANHGDRPEATHHVENGVPHDPVGEHRLDVTTTNGEITSKFA
ncbi:hypothetical protein [Amycolatopsis taiwanensis]|nr:hypothetical protein [Amycolatopsis taiwanensis]